MIDNKQQEFYIHNDKAKTTIVNESRVFVILYLFIAISSIFNKTIQHFVWTYWVLPSFIGQMFLRFYLLHEHKGCQIGMNMMSNTRTTLTWPFVNKLAWNMPFHAEHHAWPSVPFHLLPHVYHRIQQVSVKQSGCKVIFNFLYFIFIFNFLLIY